MPHIKGLLFDYGNTLLLDPFEEVLKRIERRLKAILSGAGVNDVEGFLSSWREANSEVHDKFFSHFYQEPEIVERALSKHVPDVSGELVSKILKLYRLGFKEVVSSNVHVKRVRELLLKLKGFGLKLGVVSDERSTYLREGLKVMKVANLFDVIVASEDVKREKPDPALFLHALALLRCRPNEVIYVGDDPLKDIRPAKELGMITVLYRPSVPYRVNTRWRSYRSDVAADFVITELQDLVSLSLIHI